MMKDYNYRPGVQHPDYSKLAINQKNGNNITTCRHEIIVQFFSTLTFPSLVTGPSFILISLLVLKWWQFSFTMDWPLIWKIGSTDVWVCLFLDRGKLGIPILVQMSLIKCYWTLQNVWVTAFTVSELLRENQQGVLKIPSTTRLGLLGLN